MAKKKMTLEEKLEEAIVKEEPYEVPENWCWTKLEYIFENVTSSNKKLKQKDYKLEKAINDIPVIDQGESYIGGYTEQIDLTYTGELPVIIFGDHSKCIKFITFEFVQGADGVKVLLPKSMNSKYLYYMLLNLKLPDKGYSRHYKFLREEPMQVAPLMEQQRIVDKIESLFEKLDKAKELIEEAKETFANRNIAVLEKAFNGELTSNFRKNNKVKSAEEYLEDVRINRKKIYELDLKNTKEQGGKKPKKNYEFIIESDKTLPTGWAKVKLDKLIYMSARIGWKGLKASEYTEEGPMFLSVYNLNYGDDVVYEKVYHISEERFEESPEIKVQVEDILLTKDGAGIGKLGFVKNLPAPATINSSLLLVRAQEAVLPKYLFYFFKGPHLQRLVKERITGSAIPHLFQRDIKEFYLAIPPIEEQQEIVRILDNILEKESKCIELIKAGEQIELIKKSILGKAFRGELGTNNPEEESAIELLKEILSEK